jgi:hypothetical protein
MKTITVQIPDHMTEAEAQENLRRLFSNDWITDWWHISDVQNERPDLTDEQAREVLEMVDRRRDAEIGINWQFIQYIADALFDEPEPCKYCGGSCEHDETNACDGYTGDIDSLYAATNQQEIRR